MHASLLQFVTRHRKGFILLLSMLVFAATVLQQGCHSTETAHVERARAKLSAIIIVPGFKGTALLRADTGKQVWITAGEALSGSATLALNDSRLDLADALDLKTDGLLNTIRIVPGLFSIDVYGSLTSELRKRFASDTEVIEFTYDWRQDPMEAVKALGALVSSLRARGIGSISIVAHSFGGYITAYYLRYGVQDPEHSVETWQGAGQVDKVVVIGAPFLGSMIKFRDMLTGETVGLNDSLLDATAHSSFPSSYFLLPAPTEATLVSPGGDTLPISLYSPLSWRDHAWGLMVQGDALVPQVNSGRLRFVSMYLDRGARFSSLVNAPPGRVPTLPIQILHIVGRARPTVAQATMKQNQLTFTLSEDGDGVVTARSADLPTAYRQIAETSTIETMAAHHALWKGEDVEERIVRFLSSKEH